MAAPNDVADFDGWATVAGIKCSDGRVISHHAFEQNDGAVVPLVWQHGHDNVTNVLGHAQLEKKPEGVYAYGFFNGSQQAEHARELIEHGDVTAMSIFANNLKQNGNVVQHGNIVEVSLVLKGANPKATIENVTMSHSDGEGYSAIIKMGDGDVTHEDFEGDETTTEDDSSPEGDRTIGEINIRKKYNINILALKKDGKLDMNITPDTQLCRDESMLVLGKYALIQKCFRL